MITIPSLWLAILLSAVLVWIVSAIVWMVLPHHKSDFKGLPDEDAARSTLGPQNLLPGQYNIPHAQSQGALKEPEMIKKFEDGPCAFLTVLPKGMPSMGKNLILTFLFYIGVGILVAYLSTRTLSAGADYLAVFRIAGTTAWLAYGVAYVQDAIWFGRPWSTTIKFQFDALLYALVTAGVFGWQWPG